MSANSAQIRTAWSSVDQHFDGGPPQHGRRSAAGEDYDYAQQVFGAVDLIVLAASKRGGVDPAIQKAVDRAIDESADEDWVVVQRILDDTLPREIADEHPSPDRRRARKLWRRT